MLHISTRDTCHSHQLATTHRYRPLNSRPPVLVWPARTPWMPLFHRRGQSTSSGPMIASPHRGRHHLHLHLRNHEQHSANSTTRTATNWHRNSAWGRGGKGSEDVTRVATLFLEFEPPVGKENVKCTVVTKLPASGRLSAHNY